MDENTSLSLFDAMGACILPEDKTPDHDSASSNGSTIVSWKSPKKGPVLSHIRSQTNGLQRCSEHSGKILDGLNQLRPTGLFCDVTLKAGSTTISAHRAVLASSSPYFSAMFSHPVLESHSESVTIKGVDETALVHLIDFIYTGECFVNETTVETLLPAANLLQIHFVYDACCQFLQSQLQSENCLGISRFAKLHDCTELWESSWQFAEDHFAEVTSKCDEFLELRLHEVEQLLSSDRITASEDQVMEAICRWVEHDVKRRRKATKRLFGHVRFGLLSRDQVIRLSKSKDFLVANPWCKDLLLQTAIYYLSPSDGKEVMISNQLKPRRMISDVLMVIAGNSNEQFSDVECFDFRSGAWNSTSGTSTKTNAQTPTLPNIPDIPRARSMCGVAVFQKQVYVIGGHINNNAIRFVDIYHIDLNSWTRGPELRRKRKELGVAVLGQKIYAVGGFDGSKTLYSAEALDVAAGTWRPIASMSCARQSPGVASLGGRVYAVGGQLDHEYLCSAEYYDPLTNKWTFIVAMDAPRSRLSACALDNRLYAIGGYDEEESLCTAEYYSPETDSWHPIANMNECRTGCGVVAHGGLLYVVGGQNEVEYLPTLETYDPNTDTWTLLSQEMKRSRSDAGVALVQLTHSN